MTLKEMKAKTYSLIEEYYPDNANLAEDEDVLYKTNGIINQIIMDLFRYRKVLSVEKISVRKKDDRVIDLLDELGNIYQLKKIRGTEYNILTDYLIEVPEDFEGDLTVYYYALPKLCKTEFETDKERQEEDESFKFDIDPVLLEIMPWGVGYNLLRLDMISGNGSYFEKTYIEMIQKIDSRRTAGSIIVEGGIDV